MRATAMALLARLLAFAVLLCASAQLDEDPSTSATSPSELRAKRAPAVDGATAGDLVSKQCPASGYRQELEFMRLVSRHHLREAMNASLATLPPAERLGRLLRRAADDPSFTLSIVAWSTSIGLGPRPLSDCMPLGSASAAAAAAAAAASAAATAGSDGSDGGDGSDDGQCLPPVAPVEGYKCSWIGRLDAMLTQLLPLKNYQIISMAKSAQGWNGESLADGPPLRVVLVLKILMVLLYTYRTSPPPHIEWARLNM